MPLPATMGSSTNVLILSLAVCVVAYTISLARWKRRTRGLPLPPGPKGLPILGNAAHMQSPRVWLAHAELCKTYGDIVHLPVLGHSIILLGSPTAIFDLLDKRSASTSDRQQSRIIALSGQDFNLAMMPYGAAWRHRRRELVQRFPTPITAEQSQAQWDHARVFLKKTLKGPEKIAEHIRYTFGASVVRAIYGIEVAESDDKNLALMEKVLEGLETFSPGRFLAQFLPFLEHAPYWVPIVGTQMKQLKKWRESSRMVKQTLFGLTKQQVDKGTAPPSVVASFLQESDGLYPEEVVEIEGMAQDLAITAFEGAIETTSSVFQFFIVAMWLHPDVQRKAHAELDAVVGRHRLPAHTDMAALPYVCAITRECLRWRTIAPLAVPHDTSEDIEYRGYFIPKGASLIPLSTVCLHDPERYPEPRRFLPERFIRDGKLDFTAQPDPAEVAFGYGRRICPGMAYGETTVFIHIAMTLHAFDILPPLDKHGNVITAEPEMAGMYTTAPEECRCRVKPRFEQVESLIRPAHEE